MANSAITTPATRDVKYGGWHPIGSSRPGKKGDPIGFLQRVITIVCIKIYTFIKKCTSTMWRKYMINKGFWDLGRKNLEKLKCSKKGALLGYFI